MEDNKVGDTSFLDMHRDLAVFPNQDQKALSTQLSLPRGSGLDKAPYSC